MSPHPLNLAIVGLGRWGSHLLRTFLALPEARVVAVADVDATRLAAVGDRLCPADAAAVARYTQWSEAMAHPGLDAVVIATPAASHETLVRAALLAQLHVLCEKPLTLDPATSADLCQLAQIQGRQLMVDHTYLFHPAVQRGKDLCQHLGTLRYGYAARTNLGPVRPDADVFWDLAIHDISILNHWLGQRPTAVAAWGSAWLQPQPLPGFPSGLRDAGWLRLFYPHPATATDLAVTHLEVVVQVSWANPDRQRRLGLVGDRGSLVLDETQPQPLSLHRGEFQTQTFPFIPQGPQPEPVAIAPTEPLAAMARHFVEHAIANRQSPIASAQGATDLVRIMATVHTAAETGQIVAV